MKKNGTIKKLREIISSNKLMVFIGFAFLIVVIIFELFGLFACLENEVSEIFLNMVQTVIEVVFFNIIAVKVIREGDKKKKAKIIQKKIDKLRGKRSELLMTYLTKLQEIGYYSANLNSIKIVISIERHFYMDANFTSAEFCRNISIDFMDFEKCCFQSTSFCYTKIKCSQFNRCNLYKVNFRNAEMIEVDFMDSILDDPDFNGAKLSNVDLSKVKNLKVKNLSGIEVVDNVIISKELFDSLSVEEQRKSFIASED